MPCWYFDKKDLKCTPSIRAGLDYDTERRYRKEGVRFIMQCGTAMSLGHNTIATGAVYFHRFYMFHTFQEFPRYVTACCCLFLAGKVEETPKKCRDIIVAARSMLKDTKFQAFSEDVRKAKEEVMTLESILLQTIKFDLEVEHPYTFLVTYAKCLKGEKAKIQKMVQMAWNFVNDSLSTTVCLQWEPEIIAVALIHLASKLSKFNASDWSGRQPNHLRWWDMFIADVTMEILEDICHQVLDLYQQANNLTGSESPPATLAIPKINSPAATPKINNNVSPTSKTVSPNPITPASVSVPSPLPPLPPLPSTPLQSQPQLPQTPVKQPPADAKSDNHLISKPVSNADNMHFAFSMQPPYGTMYPHSTQFQGPPPLPALSTPMMQQTMYPPHPYPQPPPAMMPTSNIPPPHYQQPPPSFYNHPPPNRISGYYPGPS